MLTNSKGLWTLVHAGLICYFEITLIFRIYIIIITKCAAFRPHKMHEWLFRAFKEPVQLGCTKFLLVLQQKIVFQADLSSLLGPNLARAEEIHC